jgi:hypothetical protein
VAPATLLLPAAARYLTSFFSTIFARPGENRREKEEKVPLCRRPKPHLVDGQSRHHEKADTFHKKQHCENIGQPLQWP